MEVARERTKAARDELRRGENPAAQKREEREAAIAAENTFGRVGLKYLEKERANPDRQPKTHAQNARYFGHLCQVPQSAARLNPDL